MHFRTVHFSTGMVFLTLTSQVLTHSSAFPVLSWPVVGQCTRNPVSGMEGLRSSSPFVTLGSLSYTFQMTWIQYIPCKGIYVRVLFPGRCQSLRKRPECISQIHSDLYLLHWTFLVPVFLVSYLQHQKFFWSRSHTVQLSPDSTSHLTTQISHSHTLRLVLAQQRRVCMFIVPSINLNPAPFLPCMWASKNRALYSHIILFQISVLFCQ